MNHSKKKKYKVLERMILVWTLVIVLAMSVMAAETSTYSCFQLSASSNGKLEVSATATGWEILAYGTDGNCGATNTETVTLTITNTGTKADGTPRAVNFKITTTGMGANDTGAAKVLDASATSLTYTATSGAGTGASTTITISFADIVQESLGVSVTTTVKPSVGGTIKVDGTDVTSQTDFENLDDCVYTLTATADSGYTFYGWMSAEGPITTDGTTSLSYAAKNAATLWPMFIKSGSAIYNIKGASPVMYYGYLDEAIAAAGNNGTVTVYQSGAVYHSDPAKNSFNIPDGVTLLIPFDPANTVIREDMKAMIENDDYTQHPAKVEYRSLTMPSGTKITVEYGGAICVGSKAHKMMVGQTGPYGAVYMDSGSNITLELGSNLYAWGYVFAGNGGAGTVTAKDGSNVYESLIVMDYPGDAGVTLDLYGGQGSGVTSASKNLNGGRAFPMRAYTVRNVEVPMTVCYGATSYGFYHLYGTIAGNHGGNIAFIGPESSGIFRLMDSASSLTKSYTGGRQKMTIDGNTEIHPLEIKISTGIASGTITSSKVSGLVLPSSYDVLCASGTGIAKDNIILCEGSTFEVADGAFAKVPSGLNMYVLDMEDDPGAVASTDVHGISYTNVSNRDALLNINGTAIIEGGFYTSNGKASIISSEGTGKIQISAPSGDKTVDLKYGTNIVKDDIPVTAAYLQNGDKVSYVSTATGGNYHYDSETNAWHCDAHVGVETDHICDVCAAVTECTDADDHNCDICGKEAISECVDADNNFNCDICGKTVCAHEGEGVVTPTPEVPAACETDGTKAYWTCGICGKSFSDETCTTEIAELTAWQAGDGKIPAKGHSYTVAENGYTWAEDFSKVTATGTCDNDVTHTATVDSNASSNVETKATCSAEGSIVYNATFAENPEWTNLVTQETTEILPVDETAHKDENPKDHICDNNCGKSDMGTHADGDDNNHTCDYCEGAVEGEECVDADSNHKCDECGETTSTCVDEDTNHACDYEGCKASMGEHKNGDKTHTCVYCGLTASECSDNATDGDHKCDVCESDYGTCNADAVIPAVDPTCAESGLTAGTKCSDCDTIQTAQTTVPALGHEYGETAYTWSEDGKTCSAKRSCTRTGCAHSETVDSTVEETVTTNPTCTVKGTTTYTATFAVEWATTQTKDVEDIPATGHKGTEVEGQVATCGADGWKDYYDCANCDKIFSDEVCTVVIENLDAWKADAGKIPATGEHDFIATNYVWGDDYMSLTAEGKCQNCEAIATAKATVTAVVSRNGTCYAMGTTTYTAVFAETWPETGIKKLDNITMDPNNHEGASIVSVEAVAATCQAPGATEGTMCDSCKAIISGCEAMEQLKHEDSNNDHYCDNGCNALLTTCTDSESDTDHNCDICGALNVSIHSYSAATYSGDGITAYSAERSCACGDKQTATAIITSSTIEPTCTAEGKTSYTATFEEEWAEGKFSEVVLEATDHAWTVSYEWAQKEDGWYCTATRTCGNDAEHNLTEEVKSTGIVLTPATCYTMGHTAYTADFAADWAETQTMEKQDVDVAPHNYGAPEWTWTGSDEDGWTAAEANFTCTEIEYCAGLASMPADIGVETIDPEAGKSGKIVYTASVDFEGKTYTDTKEVEIPAQEEKLPAITVTAPKNGKTINHTIVEADNGWNLTLTAEDTANTYAYLVKYTDADGVVSAKQKNTSGKYSDGNFAIPEGATTVTVECVLFGDVNDDAYIDSSDALVVLKYAVGSETPTEMQEIVADVNRDGYRDSSDALLILKRSVGSITEF